MDYGQPREGTQLGEEVTYPTRQDVNENRQRLKRLLDIAWMEADYDRERCEPGSKEEADYLAQQHAIETLQATL